MAGRGLKEQECDNLRSDCIEVVTGEGCSKRFLFGWGRSLGGGCKEEDEFEEEGASNCKSWKKGKEVRHNEEGDQKLLRPFLVVHINVLPKTHAIGHVATASKHRNVPSPMP